MISILVSNEYKDGSISLNLLKKHLEKLNIKSTYVVWDKQEIKSKYALMLGVWDYSLKYDYFLEFLNECDEKKITLINDSNIVRKNSKKDYLLNISNAVPSKITDTYEISKGQIIKPLVGQSGFAVHKDKEKININDYKNKALIQPFIKHDSELCLFFIQNEFFYAKQRVKNNDFRANANYGVVIKDYKPDSELINIAKKALSEFSTQCFYARVDIFLSKPYYVNEIECIEPAMYFDEFYAQIFAKKLKELILT